MQQRLEDAPANVQLQLALHFVEERHQDCAPFVIGDGLPVLERWVWANMVVVTDMGLVAKRSDLWLH